MIYLNHPLLSAEGILAELENKICKNHAQLSLPSAMEQIQKSLKSIYFTQKNFSSKQILIALQSEPFHQYPQLQYVLQHIFQNQTNIVIPEHLQDWQVKKDLFDQLNRTFEYFIITPDIKVLFSKLVDAYRKIVLFVEKSTFHDSNAYQSAYKLMVIFYDPHQNIEKNFQQISSKFIKLCKKVDHRIRFPYHDAFVVSLHHLPTYHQVTKLHDWKLFIHTEGFNSLKFFAQAHKIGYAPKNLKDARMLAIKHKYKRAARDLPFANLCKHYVIPEEVFDKGLDVILQKWPYKDYDNLPNVAVTDKNQEYTWIKLHPHDKHALILGNIIPECCQHIGGHAEQCVLNGIQLFDNGFYVLLKLKKQVLLTSSKMILNQINHQDYEIVAQAYAWRTQAGNLCLDSIEWNSNKVSADVLREIMQEFSKAVFQNHPEIKRINVGTGGMTPRHLFHNAIVNEKMKQGYVYFDATAQYCIAQQWMPNLFQQMQLAWLNTEQQKIILYLLPHFSPNESHFLIHKIAKIYSHIRPSKLHELLCVQKTLHLSDFEHISLEEYLALPTFEKEKITTVRKIWSSTYFKDLIAWLPHIDDDDLLNILKLPDDKQNAIAHLFVHQPKQIFNFLRRLKQNERLDLLNLPLYEIPMVQSGTLLYRLLQHLIAHPKELKILINMLELEDYQYLMMSHIGRPSLLEQSMNHVESFELLLTTIKTQNLMDVLKPSQLQTQYFFEKATQHPNLLKCIFNMLPLQSLLNYIISTNTSSMNLLYHASNHDASFEFLLSKIPKDLQEKSIFPQGYESDILFRGATQLVCLKHFFKYIPESDVLRILFLKNNLNIPFFCTAAQNPKAFEFLLSKIPQDIQKDFFQNSNNQRIWTTITPFPSSLALILKLFTQEEQATIFSGPHVLKIVKACAINPEAIEMMFALIPPKEHHHFMNFHFLQNLLEYPSSLNALIKILPAEQKEILIRQFLIFQEVEYALNHPSIAVIFNHLPEESQFNWIINCIIHHTPIQALPLVFQQKLIASHQLEFIIQLKKQMDNLDDPSKNNREIEINRWVAEQKFNAQKLVWTLKVLPQQHHELFLTELHRFQAFIPLLDSNSLFNFLTGTQHHLDYFQNQSQGISTHQTAFLFFKQLISEQTHELHHENIELFLNHFLKKLKIETTEDLSGIEKWTLLKNMIHLQDFIDYKRHKTHKSLRWFKSTSRQEEIEAATQLIDLLAHPQQCYVNNCHQLLNMIKTSSVYNLLDINNIEQRVELSDEHQKISYS